MVEASAIPTTETVRKLIDRLGSKEFADRLGATRGQVAMWRNRNKIPSAWRPTVWVLAKSLGSNWEPVDAEALRLVLRAAA